MALASDFSASSFGSGVGGVDDVDVCVTGSQTKAAQVLASVSDKLRSYLDFTHEPRLYTLFALWLAGTYVFHALRSYPQVFLEGTIASGKTQTLEVCSYISHDGQLLSRITGPALRDLAHRGVSLFLDEFDRVNGLTETILRAGYKQGGYVSKEVQDQATGNWGPARFVVYSPKMFASTVPLSVVNESRCIKIRTLRSSNPKIFARQLYPSDPGWQTLRNTLDVFMNQAKAQLQSIYSNIQNNTTGMYQGMQFNGRELELWNPLVALAVLFNVETEIEALAVEYVTQARIQFSSQSEDLIVLAALRDIVQSTQLDKYRGTHILDAVIRGTSEDGKQTTWMTPKCLAQILKQLFPRLQSRRDKHGTLYLLNKEMVKEACQRMGIPLNPISTPTSSTSTSHTSLYTN